MRRVLTMAAFAGIIVLIFVLFGKPVKAEPAWKNVGEQTYIRDFTASTGMPFTCVMVAGGGGMAGEVKTITCLEVKRVPNNPTPLHEGETLREILPKSRRVPVLPEQPDALGEQKEAFGGRADESVDFEQFKRGRR